MCKRSGRSVVFVGISTSHRGDRGVKAGLILSIGLNSGVGGSDISPSPDEDEFDDIDSIGHGSESNDSMWLGMGWRGISIEIVGACFW